MLGEQRCQLFNSFLVRLQFTWFTWQKLLEEPSKKRSCNVSNYSREGRISYELVFILYADSIFNALNIWKIYILLFLCFLKHAKKCYIYTEYSILLII